MRGLITMSALLGNSHDLQLKTWYISATLLLYGIIHLGTGKDIK